MRAIRKPRSFFFVFSGALFFWEVLFDADDYHMVHARAVCRVLIELVYTYVRAKFRNDTVQRFLMCIHN